MDADINLKKIYANNARHYEDDLYGRQSVLPMIREFLGFFAGTPLILDLGCGLGNESMRLANEGAKVVGIDFSRESIETARRRNPGITFHEMDFFDMDERIGVFDGIFACTSLIHLDSEGISRLLLKAKDVLKAGGLFFVLYRQGEGRVAENYEIEGENVERIVERHTRDEMTRIFKENDYDEISGRGQSGGNVGDWDSLIFRRK